MLEQYKDLNLAERILKLKLSFAVRKVKASGEGRVIDSKNNFRDVDTKYIALADFLPEAYQECEDLGLLPNITFAPDKNEAMLIVYDVTGREQPFMSTVVPTAKATNILEDQQAIGAQISYTRRYLWIAFLDLVEHDALEEGKFNNEIRAAAAATAKNPPQEKIAATPKETKPPVTEGNKGEVKKTAVTESAPVEPAAPKSVTTQPVGPEIVPCDYDANADKNTLLGYEKFYKSLYPLIDKKDTIGELTDFIIVDIWGFESQEEAEPFRVNFKGLNVEGLRKYATDTLDAYCAELEAAIAKKK